MLLSQLCFWIGVGPTTPVTTVHLCARKPARRVWHVPSLLSTYTSKVGVESELALVGVRTWCHFIDVAAHGFFVGL
jgi:hypothetical protein